MRAGSADGVLPLPAARTYEEGLPPKTRILGFWDSAIPVSSRIREDTVYSSTAQYRPEEPVSELGSCTGTSHYTGRPDYGSRQRTRPTGRDIRGSGACLRHHTTGGVSRSASYRVHFFSLAYGQECYLILVRRIHLSLHQLRYSWA